MARLYGFKPNRAGIIATMKSEGVKAQLRSEVERIAGAANGNFGLAAGTPVPMKVANGTVQNVKFDGTPKIDPYGAYVDEGAYTAIGKVVCKTALGRYDNATNNTILKSR